MREIIELLSSSPPKPPKEVASNVLSQPLLSRDVFNFDSDDFNATDQFEFVTAQAPKRRRLSPSPALPADKQPSTILGDDVFELSSDNAECTDLGIVSKQSLSKLENHRDFDIADIDDAFRFSSSAPEPRATPVTREPERQSFVFELSSDIELIAEDPIQGSSQVDQLPRPVLSERTTNLLVGLRTNGGTSLQRAKVKQRAGRSLSVDLSVNQMGKFKRITKPTAISRDEILDSSQPDTTKQSAKAVAKEKGKQSNAASKALSKAEKDAEKEAEKERKRKEKEQKAQEKQKAADIAEVNKSKTNKKNSTSEMMLDMPASLQRLSIGNQVEEYLKQLDVQVTFARDEEVNLTSDTDVPLGNIIKWRRKIAADYDEDLEIWKPLPQPRITRENHIIVYFKAEEFVKVAVVGNSSSVDNTPNISEAVMRTNLDGHVQSIRTRYPKSTIIYLIEGLSAWNRKSQTVKNRAYTAAVRSQPGDDESAPSSHTQSRRPAKRKQTTPPIDLSAITSDHTESLLLHLQLRHQPLLIHHTTSPSTTASQIVAFTQHLSTRPYRLAEQNLNLARASFCMTTGQIRTGATPHETYINMLQEINRVTPSMAYGISNAGYRSVSALVDGFRANGNLMLEDVRKSVNKDGGWSDRRLGPMVSKRLYKVFMGRDPGARDGIA